MFLWLFFNSVTQAQPWPDTLRFENIPDVIRLAKKDALEDFKNSGSLKWVGVGVLPLITGRLLTIGEENYGLSYPSHVAPVFMLVNMLAPMSVFIIPIKIPNKRYHENIFETDFVRREYEKSYRNRIIMLRIMHTWPIQLFSYFIMFLPITLPID